MKSTIFFNIILLLIVFLISQNAYSACPSQCSLLGKNFLANAAGCLNFETPILDTSSGVTSSPVGRTSEFMYEKLNTIAFGHATVLSSDLRWENINIEQPGDDIEAAIWGGTLDFSYTVLSNDEKSFTFGIYIPYDYFDYDHSIINHIHQLGTILYGIYEIPILNDNYNFEFMGHFSYYHDFIDLYDSNNNEYFIDDDADYVGIGLGFGINKTKGIIRPGFFSSFQYSHSYSNLSNDYYLFRTGVDVEVSVTNNWYVSLFGSWVIDLTNYDPPKGLTFYDKDMFDNDDFWKVGIETGYSLGGGWEFNIGYRKILGLRNFDSDKVYLGMLWKF